MAGNQQGRLGKSPGEAVKSPVIVSSISNIALTGLPIISGVQLVEGDRVLVKDQSDSTQNGIYCAFVGNWDRAKDWNKSDDVINGQLVVDSNSGQVYRTSFTGDFSINVTKVSFFETITGEYVRKFNTLSDAIGDTSLMLGDTIDTKERTTSNAGGGLWDAVLASSVTISPGSPVNGGVVQCSGVVSLALVLRLPNSDPRAWGAVGDGSTLDDGAFTDIESLGSEFIIDLNGLTYAVSSIPSLKSYTNGFFKVGSLTSPSYGLRYNGKIELAGMQPARLNETTLRMQPGYCSDGATTPTTTIIVDSRIDMDLTTVGLNGMDVGSGVVGEDYFVYAIKNISTAESGFVLSKEISTTLVTLPAGFTRLRKLPFGFVWLAADGPIPAGIPPFHLAGWPDAKIEYTDMDDNAPWEVLPNNTDDGTSPTLTAFSCAGLVPDNARQVLFHCELESLGSAGAAHLRTSGSGGNGKPVGFVSDTVGNKSYGEFTMRVTSTRNISYKTEPGTKLTVRVAGYSMTEQS